ncbi:MAG TPA: serine hydrolase domain-containing protein [Acidimicrobiales bacterium]|nr:serine hydrolase domain-containing protein [Acidimicrobiales bacterium]
MIDRSAVEEALAAAPTVPGLSVAWRAADGEVETAVFGKITPGGPDLTPETIFQAGSVSKPVTAVGILRLVDQGVVDLDTDVNDILTSWKVPPVDDWQPVVTLRRLLTHTAGLTVHGFGGYAHDADVPTVPQLLNGEPPSNSGAVRVAMMPGLIWKYSGGGTTVAQQLIVDATGTPFPELLRELVLEPAGMGAATFEQPLPARLHDLAATAHLADGSPVVGRWHTYPEMAAAGLWCAPKDLVAFAGAVQNALSGGTHALLSPELAKLLVTAAYPEVSESMGVGFFLSGGPTDAGHERFGHGGADHGFLTDLSADIAGRRAAAAMVHSFAGGPALRVAVQAAGRAIGWAEPEDAAAPLSGVDESELMAALADGYLTEDGRTFKLRYEAGLSLIAPGQPPLPLEMISVLNWISRLGLTMSFEVAEGRITGISIHQAGTTIKARRSTYESEA